MRRAGFIGLFVAIAACGAFDASSDDTTPKPGADAGAPDSGGASPDGGGPEAGPTELDGGVEPDGATTADFASTVMTIPGLVSYWHLDDVDAQKAHDAVGGNDGTYQTAIGGAPGLLGDGDGKAADFMGGAVAVTGTTKLTTFDKSLTVGALVRPRATNGDRFVVAKHDSFLLGFNNTNPIFEVSHAGAGPNRLPTSVSVGVNVRAFLVGSFDATGGAQTFWVNGQIAAKQAGEKPLSAANTNGVCIGSATVFNDPTPACSPYPFDGTIDEVFVASEPISDELVKKLAALAGFEP